MVPIHANAARASEDRQQLQLRSIWQPAAEAGQRIKFHFIWAVAVCDADLGGDRQQVQVDRRLAAQDDGVLEDLADDLAGSVSVSGSSVLQFAACSQASSTTQVLSSHNVLPQLTCCALAAGLAVAARNPEKRVNEPISNHDPNHNQQPPLTWALP